MSFPRPWFLALLLLASGCDEDAATPPATPPVAAAPTPDAGPGAELGRLEGLSGEVRLERGGTPVPAAEGPLYEGDAVETGVGGAATVRFPDGRSVEVGPDARFAMGKDSGGIVMQVERGIVLSRVPAVPRAGSAGTKVTLSILTPFGLTRVGSDAPSEVRVAVAEDAGSVEVRLGAIEFVGKDGQQLRATEGESVAVAGGKVEVVRAPRVVELAPIPVTVRLGAGRAEVRPQGTVRWRPVKKQGEVLAPGDGVRTRPGGTAVLALEGSSSVLSLGSGTELVLESAGQGGNTDEARVDLRQGGLGLQLAPGRTSRVVLPGLSLEGNGAAGVEVRRTAGGYLVDAFTGQVTLVRGASRQPLRAGERARLEGESGTARVEPLSQAALVLGPGAGAEVFHQGLSEVALTWEGEGEAVVEVALDAGFTRPVVAGTVFQPFVNVSAPSRGVLHWRVRRKDGTEVAKGSAAFAPERLSRDLDRVRNVVPEGPEKTTIFYQDKPPAVTFTYGEEASAASYRVAVYRVGALGTPVAERTVPDTRAALDAGALGEGSYLWSVTPLSASGAQLKGGRMNKLELVYDNSVPMLVVTSPRNGTRAGDKVRATGVAPVDARLSINGRPVPLDGKHRFSTWVEPLGTPPLLVFKMSRPGAPEVYTVRTLRQRGP
ncbi:FecR domain-containing protein [Pyxidicoccus trucidator]|uniref:FecR domain-containing protein n=1 Tax=Pyxidicoccus trucidator TaxID=2709662 RepID=UPI0013DB7401|nr:FecR domain-containing protein [Pyxidicoccus trucidator]